MTCTQGRLTVVVSNGVQTWEGQASVSSYAQVEHETCRLLALATLHVSAPDVLPLLEADQQQETSAVSAEAVQMSLIQELTLVPVLLPLHHYDRRQYQVSDLYDGIWRFCEPEVIVSTARFVEGRKGAWSYSSF